MPPPRVEHRCGLTAGAQGALRRAPTEAELASSADFAGVHHEWENATGRALGALKSVTAAWRLDLRRQITANLADGDPEALPDLTVSTLDATQTLVRLMEEYAVKAGQRMQREAEAQGVKVPEWSLPEDTEDAVTAAVGGRRLLTSVAQLASDLAATTLIQAAKRKLSGLLRSTATPEQIAGEVDRELAGVDDSGIRAAVGSAMTAAQNTGRRVVLEAAPAASSYLASEILDRRTCENCKDIDGATFTTLDAAMAEYPVMGYRDCVGARYGNACRGFIVAVWQEVRAVTSAAQQGTKDADDQLAALYAAEREGAVTSATESTEELEALAKGEPNPGTKKDKRLKENMGSEGDCPPGLVWDKEAEKCVEPVGDMAVRGVAALADQVDDRPASEIGTGATAPWRGPLTVEGVETGDGREFRPEALTWADLPLPLRWNKEDSHGGEPHTVAVNVGRIDKIWREESGLIMGEGVLDLSDGDGQRVHDKIKGGFLRGVSVDVDSIKDADMELVWPADPDADGEGSVLDQLFASPEKVVFNRGRIRAATLVDIPAFAEAYIALLSEDGAVVAGGEPAGPLAWKTVQAPRPRSLAVQAPLRPPAGWFTNPGLSVPTGITVTPDGRVYGHAALWGTCHIGQAGVCVTPPHEEDHPYFMTGNVWTEDDASVSVGQITVGTGHAPLSYGHRAAADHYDNTGAAVADVAVGNDGHGIWVAGAVRPGTPESRIHELRAAGQVSGDWRRIGGQLRLVGLLAVNVPGFPVPKLKTHLTSGQQVALVAAGIPQLSESLSEEELDQWAYRRVLRSLSRKVHRDGEE